MVRCPACATENAADARFCNGCGSRLSSAAVASATISEERKVITALFCDLVGFTATSEGGRSGRRRPDAHALLRVARSQIELHGGVVEKFIGDAVVGVFGVPVAHGDDPERAVRAALRIADEAADCRRLHGAPLRLRIGINTGQALVRARISPRAPASGSLLATASTPRLGSNRSRPSSGSPSARRRGGRPASRSSTRSCRRPCSRARPSRSGSFTPSRPRASPRDRRHTRSGQPVRRSDAGVRDARTMPSIARSRRTGVEFATIVGEPGLGKSRLVAELLAHVGLAPDCW